MAPDARARHRRRAALLLAALMAFGFLISSFERAQVYHPTRGAEFAVQEAHPEGEDFFLTTPDGVRLHAWFLPGRADSPRGKFCFLYCHGNGGNLTGRPGAYRALLETGAGVLAFDYRGYGKSGGRVNEAGTYTDALAAFDWLMARGVAPARIIVWGESLGGGIASHVAEARPAGGLVLQSSFTSIPDVAAELFPFLPVRWIGRIQYDTHARLARIRCPVVVAHSPDDEIIPFAHARRNFAAAREPKALMELAGGHNDALIASRARYVAAAEAALRLAEPAAVAAPNVSP